MGPSAGVALAPGRVPLTWSRFRYPQSLYKYGGRAGRAGVRRLRRSSTSNIPLERLPGMLGRMGEMLARRYFPPNVSHILQCRVLALGGRDAADVATSPPCSAILIAIPLAWFASYNMTPRRRFLYPVARLVIMACRSVHEMIWTILLVDHPRLRHAARRAGADAVLHRLRGQALLRGDRGDRARARSRPSAPTGANDLQVFVYAVLPQVRVAWTGISIYTWDVVFRAATVVGFFGAGGMGWYLRDSVQRVASKDVAAILLSIIVVVIISELLSAWLRTRIAKAIA